MGVGNFEKPGAGPKIGGPTIGQTIDYSKLSEDQKAQIGDLESLKAPQTSEPEMSPEDAARAQQGAEQLDALNKVLAAAEQVEEPDEAEARLQELAAPTEDDKREFLRCVLGGTLYTKRYEMYGGLFVMELHDIHPSYEDVIFTTLAKEVAEGRITTEDDWSTALDRLRLVTNVSMVRLAKNAPVKCSVPEGAELLPLVGERMQTFPTTALFRAALQTVRVFMRHLELILDRALDPDFWEVGGLDSLSEPMSEEQSVMADDRR